MRKNLQTPFHFFYLSHFTWTASELLALVGGQKSQTVQDDRNAMVTQISSLYIHGEQKISQNAQHINPCSR